MYKQGKRFTTWGGTLLVALVGGLLPASFAWAEGEPNLNDNLVQTVTYFPMPYITYNSIYIGKKLDIGISQAFEADFGNASCAGTNVLKLTGELPSLWLPKEDASGNDTLPTPLILRSRAPDGTSLTSKLSLDSFPLYVKEVEVGQRDRTGSPGSSDLKLVNTHTTVGMVNITVPNLAFGNSAESPNELSSLTVSNMVYSDVTVEVKDGSQAYAVSFPRCDRTGGANWASVTFGGVDRMALVCGNPAPKPFQTTYTCYNTTDYLWCQLNDENKFYCDISGCADNYRWQLDTSGFRHLVASQHKDYCKWLKSGEFSPAKQKEVLIDTMMQSVDSNWKSYDCGANAPDTDWSTTVPTMDHCYYITTEPDPADVECLTATEENPDPNNTEVTKVQVDYQRYNWEQYSYEDGCISFCRNAG